MQCTSSSSAPMFQQHSFQTKKTNRNLRCGCTKAAAVCVASSSTASASKDIPPDHATDLLAQPRGSEAPPTSLSVISIEVPAVSLLDHPGTWWSQGCLYCRVSNMKLVTRHADGLRSAASGCCCTVGLSDKGSSDASLERELKQTRPCVTGRAHWCSCSLHVAAELERERTTQRRGDIPSCIC